MHPWLSIEYQLLFLESTPSTCSLNLSCDIFSILRLIVFGQNFCSSFIRLIIFNFSSNSGEVGLLGKVFKRPGCSRRFSQNSNPISDYLFFRLD